MKIASFLFACLTVFAQTKPAPPQKTAFDKATLEAYLRHVELWIPQVAVKVDDMKKSTDVPGFFEVWVHLSYNAATKDEMFLVSADGHKIFKGDVYDVNKNPFQPNLDRLKVDGAPSFGPANAPVTMVVFSDFQCPVCKEEAVILRKNIATAFPEKVRVYFKDFPLDAVHNWARTAAIAGRCVYRQKPGAFWDYFDWVYENQGTIGLDNFNSKLNSFAMDKGLDGMQLGRCIEGKATEAEVNKTVDEGRGLQVGATPTMYLNGRKLEGGIQWQGLEQLIKIEVDHQAKAQTESAEKCCEVTIPKIVK